MESDPKDDEGVVDGPNDPAEPEGDPKQVGPDGTEYDEDATDEVRRKMGVDD